jgi:hypothetical protein
MATNVKDKLEAYIKNELSKGSGLFLCELKRFPLHPVGATVLHKELVLSNNVGGGRFVAATLPVEVSEAVVDLCAEGKISFTISSNQGIAAMLVLGCGEAYPLGTEDNIDEPGDKWLILSLNAGINPDGGRWKWADSARKATRFIWEGKEPY